MTVVDITSEIEQNQKRVRGIKQELENMVPSIIEAASIHTISWSKAMARATAEQFVAKNPSNQEALGLKMVGLKADVDELVKSLPEQITPVLNRDDLWVHREKNLETGLDSANSEIYHGSWSDAKSVLYGFVGKVLIEHGFARDYGDCWRRPYENESKHYRYKAEERSWQPSDDIDKAREPYLKKWKELVQVRYHIRKLEKDKAKAITTSVWE